MTISYTIESAVFQMFPEFRREWIRACHVWRADHAQPVVSTGYASLIPVRETALRNLKLVTMAQVYPEDRGTNYAIRDGRGAARALVAELADSLPEPLEMVS